MINSILSNRYRILREIGAGGMAKVYLAEDINEARLVAVKVLYAHFGEDVSYLQRFKREAKLAGFLDNPHIVKVIDYGSSRDIHYLIMEYVEGQDLREALIQRGPFLWPEALRIIDQICQALENANEYNIVHRDIKPQNVMITKDNVIKVLDFGIARARMLPSLTQSGFVGSPYYISPEQAMGEDVDIRSDLYSTGIVLYELLSGHVPFDSKSPWSIISKHIVSELPEFKVEDNDLPPAVQVFIKKLVAKRPEDRLQTPTEVRKAIAALLAGQDMPAASPVQVSPVETLPTDRAKDLFKQADRAIAAEDWQKAIGLLTRLLKSDPQHAEANRKLEYAGLQARLAALYKAATKAIEDKQRQEAIDELTEILKIEPDYKDCHTLLEQAQALPAHVSGATEDLAELYEAANAAFEAGDYKIAEEKFGQIKKNTPAYRQADALWAESKRRSARAGGFNRLSEQISAARLKSSLPVGWPIGAALVIIAIVVAVLVVSRRPPEPPSPADASALWQQAQTAVAQNNTAEAMLLLEQVLSLNPDHPEALALKEQLAQQTAQTGQLAQAVSAIADKDWTRAAEILESLRGDPTFQPDTVNALLCDAYLARGKERLNKVINPKDQATVQAALADFQAGPATCRDNPDVNTQIDFARQYILALKPDQSAAEIIKILQPVVKAEPNYAGGQASVNLYNAYLQRGTERQAKGQTEQALEDFNLALSLNVEDLSEAQSRQAQLLQNLTTTGTPTAVVTTTQEASVETPSATEDATPVELKYSTPRLLSPEPFANFSGQYTEVILTWEGVGALDDNEFYDVTVRYFVGEEPRYAGSGLIKETSWRVPVEAGYGIAGKDQFDWWVTVRLGGTASNGRPDIALSPSSEERSFFWKP